MVTGSTPSISRQFLIAIAAQFNKQATVIRFPDQPSCQDCMKQMIGPGMCYAWEILVGGADVTTINIMLRIQTGDEEKNRDVSDWFMRRLNRELPTGLACVSKRKKTGKEATKYDIRFSLEQCRERSRSELVTEPVRLMRLLVDRTFPMMAERIRLNEEW